MSESSTNDQTRNEGEGNRTADRQYREGVRRHVESGASAGAANAPATASDRSFFCIRMLLSFLV